MTGHAALPPDDPTPPDGIPTPPAGVPTAPAPSTGETGGATDPTRPAEATRTATPRRLQAVPDAYPTVVTGVRTGAFGRPIGKHRPTALHRLVEAARVLTGGLMVLTLVVVVAPLVLGAVGPGWGVLVGHVVGAVVALAATGLAAWRRTPVWAATVAALVVPVDVLAVLTLFWWR
ncbi:hypothetical protein [Actinomycetospora sp. TBRC 11914]|uniref:hypothetical protein n=1 Tax=Actinomycetospora sp. TBRC 11914 TaxID=2729387 RepID=UPI00145EED8D|nr:hypothetical protein [Actinomycetospora sp. TBRC 11914]NMO88789.1 hypothetical protein [Actinomycetospora sp. TBRC 11914]